MPKRLSDTPPEIEKVLLKRWRAMSPEEKMRVLKGIILTGQKLAMAGLRMRFPAAGPAGLRRRLATLLLGAELAEKVYGPAPHHPTLG